MSLEQLKRLQLRIARLEREAKTERYRELVSDVKSVRQAQKNCDVIIEAVENLERNWRSIDPYASTMYSMSQYGSVASQLYDDINQIGEVSDSAIRMKNALNSVLKVIKEEMQDER